MWIVRGVSTIFTQVLVMIPLAKRAARNAGRGLSADPTNPSGSSSAAWQAKLLPLTRNTPRLTKRTVARLAVSVAIVIPGNGFASVTVTDALDEGIACFKIESETATYYYDKQGAGFTSILDRDGVDWIGFRPEGTPDVPNGQSGWYRGIPNMGLNAFGHPGYAGAFSTTKAPLGRPLPKVTIDSKKAGWHVTWEIFPTFARMTVQRVPDAYWLLYEGTPGGALGPDDICWRADGTGTSCSEPWEGDIVVPPGDGSGIEWVAFADTALDRAFFLAHRDDQLTDLYFSMGTMTVFGFGRRHLSWFGRLLRKLSVPQSEALLHATPKTLLIGFAESRDFTTIQAQVEKIGRFIEP